MNKRTTNCCYSSHLEGDVLIFVDLDSNNAPSVTNDAGWLLHHKRDELGPEIFDALTAVIYRDSDCVFDGLLYDPHKRTVEFYPIRLTCEREAVVKAREMHRGATRCIPAQLKRQPAGSPI